jgi:hypothetical protein
MLHQRYFVLFLQNKTWEDSAVELDPGMVHQLDAVDRLPVPTEELTEHPNILPDAVDADHQLLRLILTAILSTFNQFKPIWLLLLSVSP